MSITTGKPAALLPEKYTLIENALNLCIQVRWYRLIHVFTFLLAIIWISFIAVFYSPLVEGNIPALIYLFPAVHVGFGIGMLYSAVCGLVNRTQITATARQLRIRHAPLPWKRNLVLFRPDIGHLHITEQFSTWKGVTLVTYSVQALTTDDQYISLVQDLEHIEHARLIKSKLESYLQPASIPAASKALAS
jgi:hypothetical protein